MALKVVPSAYLFTRREPGLFVEIYFPKRIVYQTAIIEALSEGVDEKKVKRYFKDNVRELLAELAAYPPALDPRKYEHREQVRFGSVTVEEAKKRIEMYRNPFFGWSLYHVEGAFFDRRTKMVDDELTQVVRIIFRFESKRLRSARKKGCEHLVRSISSWILINYYHRVGLPPWGAVEQDRFIAEHGPFSEDELEYVKHHYADTVRETVKWFDDSVLFSFGFLVRRFWKRVIDVGHKEDQIWVTSFFNLGINVVQPIPLSRKGGRR